MYIIGYYYLDTSPQKSDVNAVYQEGGRMIRRINSWTGVFCGLWIGAFVFISLASTSAQAAEYHGHGAAHGGALVGLEYGDKEVAHLELQLDPDSGELKAYLTDAEAQNPARIPQEAIEAVVLLPGAAKAIPLELTAVENAATGEAAGDASVFSVRSEALKGARNFSVSIASIFVQGYEVSDIRFTYPQGDH
jgi:hypothetical protein